jgi:hypothetical protein
MEPERTSETVSSTCDFCYSLLLKSFHDLIERRTCMVCAMGREPGTEAEGASRPKSIYRDRITVEVIGNNGLNQMQIRDGLEVV